MTAGTISVVRRSEEERIADLEKQIEALKQRKARKLVQRDPTLKHMHAAVRSIDNAMAETHNTPTRQALGEARATLGACLALTSGAAPRKDKGLVIPESRPARAAVSEEALLSHVRQHPGQRGEEIAAAFGTDAGAVRPIMKRLIKGGSVKAQGQARATSYAPV